MQNGGDYDIPALTLKRGLGAGKQGFDLHVDDQKVYLKDASAFRGAP
jgi:hypothetical protein